MENLRGRQDEHDDSAQTDPFIMLPKRLLLHHDGSKVRITCTSDQLAIAAALVLLAGKDKTVTAKLADIAQVFGWGPKRHKKLNRDLHALPDQQRFSL